MRPILDQQIESFVIGAGIHDVDILSDIDETCFFVPKHRVIFKCIKILLRKGIPIDIVSLSNEVQKNGLLASDVVAIADEFCPGYDIASRIEQLRKLSTLRKIQSAFETDDDATTLTERIQEVLDSGADTKSRKLHLLTPSQILTYERPTCLIEPFLFQGSLNILGGAPGKGKSLLALSLIISVLSGKPWLTKFTVVPGPVLLIDEETPRGFLRDRFEKMGISEKLPLHILHFSGMKVDNEISVKALVDVIRSVRPMLVVFDSLIRFHSQDENEARGMSRVMAAFRRVANEGPTVLAIHHHRKVEGSLDFRSRGSSDIIGSVDTEFSLTEKDGVLTFGTAKTRVAPFGPVHFRLEVDETIRLVYQGTASDLLYQEIIEILADGGRLTVNEIFDQLGSRKIETGINRLRNVLKQSVGNGVGTEKERCGMTQRWVYFMNDLQGTLVPLHGFTPLIKGGGDPLSAQVPLHGQAGKTESDREVLTLDSQGFASASQLEKRGGCEAVKRSNSASRLDEKKCQKNGASVKRSEGLADYDDSGLPEKIVDDFPFTDKDDF
jgi:archaellum biogenesis ATPase FlaH